MMFSSTPPLNTSRSGSTVLINPVSAGDTGIETRAVTALPARGAFFVVVTVGGEAVFTVTGSGSDEGEDHREKGK